jgi:hypothetical protein
MAGFTQLEHFFRFVVRNARPRLGGKTALNTNKNVHYFCDACVSPEYVTNRTYAQKSYNLDGIVRAYRRLAKPMPFAPTLGTFCVSPINK